MKKNIICILIFTLLIANVISISSTATDHKIKKMVDENKSIFRLLPITPYKPPLENYVIKQNNMNAKNLLGKGWYWLKSYTNYAPSGIPDFDQKQKQWKSIVDGGNGIAESIAMGDDVQYTPVGQPVDPWSLCVVTPGHNCALDSELGGDDFATWLFCVPTSFGNCLWWFDSKYSDTEGSPGDGEDDFPLIEDYGAGDDHSSDNAIYLIEELARNMNTTQNGVTYIEDVLYAINKWFIDLELKNHLELNIYKYPTTFEFISGEIEEGKCVFPLVYFCLNVGGQCEPVASHLVTCAGVNYNERKIAFSDPLMDVENPGGPGHNDAQYVSHDIYDVNIGSPCSNYPEIEWWLPDYWSGYIVVAYETFIVNISNEKPNTPTIDGPTEGIINTPYTFTFNSVDPDDDEVYYDILWGDGYTDKRCGPYSSGEDFKINHTYTKKGTFTIEVTAKDIFKGESGTFTQDITIPRYRNIYNFNLINRYLETYPILYEIFKFLLIK